MKKIIKVKATTQGLIELKRAVDDFLINVQCNHLIHKRISIIVDELASNIIQYAYPSKVGKIVVRILHNNNFIQIEFIDRGIPYDPLKKEEPDIHLPIEERSIGGLGIYMVKQMVGKIIYKRRFWQNHLIVWLAIK